jgi:hypothetical protein
MGVPISNVTRRVVYVASGTGPYNFTFEILAATDIAVYRDDTLLTLTTDYSVTINSNGTGFVTLVATPTGATQIAIVGNRTIQRTTDFVTGGDFFANTVNDEMDQQTIFAQQNAEAIQRALIAPQTDPTSINMTLPRASERASKYLGFDANGNPIATAGTSETPDLGTMSAQNANNVSISGGTIAGITDLAIADGGTGASSASQARTNLGLGTIATQNANSVAVTGGSLDNVSIGGTSTIPAASITGQTAIANGGTGSNTAGNALVNLLNGSSFGFRNRIINGDMRIDQRNAGASVTQGTGILYTVDRWGIDGSANSKFTAQQSSVFPTGFVKSLLITSSAATTVGSGDYYYLRQAVEGFNFADLGWGAAGAQSVTLSFWVRSSLTGTFGGSLRNNDNTRSYPFTYAISAANTWEQKTVTIAGDTSGTWSTTNTTGVQLNFGFGVGSTYSGTAGAWAGTNYLSATGATSVVGTSGATFYVTGVQLEAGSVATPFERRDYGRELMMCQRYYYENPSIAGTGLGANTIARANGVHPVEMRAGPSVTVSNAVQFFNGNATVTCTGGITNYSSTRMFSADLVIGGSGASGDATIIVQPSTGKITVSAEL